MALAAVATVVSPRDVHAQAAACAAGETTSTFSFAAGSWVNGSLGPNNFVIGTAPNDVTMTVQLAGTFNGAGPTAGATPKLDSIGNVANTLIAAGANKPNNSLVGTFTLSFNRPVNKLRYFAMDVDALNTAGNLWQDQIITTGSLNGASVTPSAVSYVLGSVGTTAIVAPNGTATATYGNNNCAVTSANCNVQMDYINPVSQVTLDYREGSAPGVAANNQYIGINTFSLCVPPRPTLAKAYGPTSVGVGASSTLTFTITNGTGNPAQGNIAFTDTFPAGVTVTSVTPLAGAGCTGTPANTANTVTLSNGWMAAGTASCTFTATVQGVTAGSYVNAAAAFTGVTGGLNTAATTATLTVTPAPNLTLTKSNGTTTVNAGGTTPYTLTVGNTGNAATTGTITVVDVLPAGLTIAAGAVPLTGAQAANWTCTAAGQNITCTSTTAIAVGGSSVFIITPSITATTTGTVVNKAQVGGGGDPTNPTAPTPATAAACTGANTPTEGCAIDTDTVNAVNLGLTKSNGTTTVTAGGTTTYTLTVANTGNVASSGLVTVVDVLPAGTTIAAGAVPLGGAQAANWTCTAAGQNITCTSNTAIAAGASSVFSFTPSVTAGATGTIVNPAKVGGGGDPTNPTAPTPATASVCTGTNTPAEGCAVDTDTVNAVNLGLAKSNGVTTVNAGGTTNYTLTVTNSGNIASTGLITIVDVLPTGMTIATGAVALSGAQAANWNCSAAGQVVTCTSSTAIAAGGTSAFSFTPNISSGATGTLTNPAKVGGGGDPTNPTAPTAATAGVCTGANTPSEGCAVDTDTVISNGDMSPVISGLPATAAPGATVTGTIVCTNAGPAAATNATCTTTGNNGATVTPGACTASTGTAASLPVGATLTCPITVLMPGTAGGTDTVPVDVTVTGTTGATNDSVPGNNTTTALITLIDAVNDVATVNGSTVGATTNLATNDQFPAGSTFTVQPGSTCVAPVTVSPAGVATYTTPASGSCTVNYQVCAPAPNTTQCDTATLTVSTLSPDLQMTKTTTSTFTVGQNASYTLTPNNLIGSAPTVGTITVTDTLPSGLTYVAAGSGGAGWTCTAVGQVVTCTSTAVIAVGGTGAPITINVSVGAIAVPTVTNIASVAGGGEAPANSANNSAVVTSPVGTTAVNTFLTDGAQTGLPGTSVFYPHTFNAGSAGTVSFGSTDIPNPNIPGWTTQIFLDTNCDGTLSAAEAATPLTGSVPVTAGQQVCIVVRSNIPPGAPANARDVITTAANFTPAGGGPVQTLTRQDITTVGAIGSGLTLSKSVRNVTQGTPAGTNNTALPGDVLEYTITYANSSNSPVSTILVTDITPAFTNFISAQCTTPLPAALTNCAVTAVPAVGAAGTVQWTLTGSLNATQSGTVTFRVTVQQ